VKRFLRTVTIAAVLSLTSLALGQGPVVSATTPELYFNILPSKQLFFFGEPVKVILELYSRFEQPILVSRLQGDDFVSFRVVGPDGNEIPWHGEVGPTTGYSASDFTVLGQYKLVNAERIISLKDGTGFAFDKPGQYTLAAEFSMGSPEKFASFADQAKPAMGVFHSRLSFCIEACILEPLQVSKNVPQPALEAVRMFYTNITRYRPLGIPSGRGKKALWPLLSKRLAQELDKFEACDKEYYRRHGEILRANTYKPATPWLEEGLFTGPDEAATPHKFRILGSRAIGQNRVDVKLEFTSKQTYSTDSGLPPSYEHYEGDVTVIVENSKWVIDDYVALYGNNELQRLSAGYPECKDGQWVGEESY
jgi:hypothetical protein